MSELSVPRDLTTGRLRLRPIRAEDSGFWLTIHRDPALWGHAPFAMPQSDAEALAGFDQAVAHWEEHGRGYRVVESLEGGERVGVAGLRHDCDGLNLYYRFAAAAHGRGDAREAARAAVAEGLEWWPGESAVHAVIRPDHQPSIRVAERAGLDPDGTRRHASDPADLEPSVLYRAPRAERVAQLDRPAREEILDLWCRVNDAGGAVGFLPGAPREIVAEALAAHEDLMARGRQTLVVLRAPDGRLRGLAFWETVANLLLAHCRWLYRVMVDPDQQGRGLGLLLMAGLHRVAREDGVEITSLGVRGGTGTTAFYRQCGYEITGRIQGAIRLAPGDDRDDITMSRRLDGRVLPPSDQT
ncbi:MAG: GNAT family N-acetyltransferase [Micrococcales bacterium]|nr:GNAT family N-acetyltransferase [Micrococcales bacterium]